MTIQKRNRIRRELAETASRLTRYTAPFPGGQTHDAYLARLARARSYYASWGVPSLLAEIERGRSTVRDGMTVQLPSAVAP